MWAPKFVGPCLTNSLNTGINLALQCAVLQHIERTTISIVLFFCMFKTKKIVINRDFFLKDKNRFECTEQPPAASTHKSATTHVGSVFVTRDLDLLGQ